MGIEIIIIIAVIFFVLMFINGGLSPLLVNADYQPPLQLTSSQYQCEEVVWSAAPVMISDRFNGTVELRCEFEGLEGGGIIGLRRHLLSTTLDSAQTVHAGPIVENYHGLPSVAHDVQLKIKSKGETVSVRGMSHLATDGFTQLRSVFEGTDMPTSGKARYLRSLRTEINVTTTDRPGWYRARIVHHNIVKKPWFAGSKLFRNTLVEKTEESFETRAYDLINELANHL